jgi:hypothetical protein
VVRLATVVRDVPVVLLAAVGQDLASVWLVVVPYVAMAQRVAAAQPEAVVRHAAVVRDEVAAQHAAGANAAYGERSAGCRSTS